jgi:hypothetical protein
MRITEPTAETSPQGGVIPLAYLAIELAESIDVLAARLGSEVQVDDIGMRCVTRETARRTLADEREEEAEREALWQRQRDDTLALAAAQQAAIPAGVAPPAGLENLTAVQLLGAGATAARLDAAGDRFEEFASGDVTFHPIDGGE